MGSFSSVYKMTDRQIYASDYQRNSILSQLLIFYDAVDILDAMRNVTNKNDINEIKEYIDNVHDELEHLLTEYESEDSDLDDLYTKPVTEDDTLQKKEKVLSTYCIQQSSGNDTVNQQRFCILDILNQK